MEQQDKRLEILTKFMAILKDQPNDDIKQLIALAKEARDAGYPVLGVDIEEITCRFIREDAQVSTGIREALFLKG